MNRKYYNQVFLSLSATLFRISWTSDFDFIHLFHIPGVLGFWGFGVLVLGVLGFRF